MTFQRDTKAFRSLLNCKLLREFPTVEIPTKKLYNIGHGALKNFIASFELNLIYGANNTLD